MLRLIIRYTYSLFWIDFNEAWCNGNRIFPEAQVARRHFLHRYMYPLDQATTDAIYRWPVIMIKYTNKRIYHPFAPTLTSSHENQVFEESVDLVVCVAMVFRGGNKDWIGHWMTFCELPTITVTMSIYKYSLLFRYPDWHQSWMIQIAEVYNIQIDLNSKWLWHFR